MSEVQIKATWGEMWRLIAVAFPRWVIRRMTERSANRGFAVKAIPFVIMFLSVASIANLSSRAFEHHANFSSYMTGAGIAVLVPIAVIAAMIVEGRWSWAFWIMAVIFAAISGTIQYNIYLLPGGGAMAIAEAVAFGYGVPLSEVMLAIMEARLIIQIEQRKRQEQERLEAAQCQATEIEQRRQEAVAERRRRDEIEAEEREFERQRKLAELEAYKLKLQQDTELERQKALAALRIKEQKALAKVVKSDSLSDSVNHESSDSGASDESVILHFYSGNPLASQRDASKKTGLSQSKISRILNQLESDKVIHRNGNGVEILRSS